MKVRGDILRVYKDVHIWVGILSSLMLFVAFYAGALTVFEPALVRWAAPPTQLAPPPPLGAAQGLMQAVLARHPEAAADLTLVVTPTPEQPARVIWRERGATRGQSTTFGASLAPDGSLQVERLAPAPVAGFIDALHQRVGLPLADGLARTVMGVVALLYAVALVSGVVLVLPTLARDLFALRIGANLKRMWLDVHNALGIVSLPFHLVMALTSVVFAFHDPIYEAQGKLVYGGDMPWEAPHPVPSSPAPLLAPEALLHTVQAQLPGLTVTHLSWHQTPQGMRALVTGQDSRWGTRQRTHMSTPVDPYTGAVDAHELPSHMAGYDAAVNAFFMLHFGSFGGDAVRLMYLLLGLAGAVVFYSGNLLWIESRRKSRRAGQPPPQARNAEWLARLTVGVSLGCAAGVSATLAAARWLPQQVAAPAAWHEGIYHAVFVAAVVWALARGAARAAPALLALCTVFTLCIPLASALGAWSLAGAWRHPGAGVAVDLAALAFAAVFAVLARAAHRRAVRGRRDSVWAASPAASW
ncbi:MAG: PepSY domain-containing protein [Proteobacteria bacterium]|nr:PepSY domain-containing protein [Pseudomonadota bacterium]